MAENTNPAIVEDGVEMTGEQYIAAINELKSTTVSRDSYNKLKQENKQLLDSLVSGTLPDGMVPAAEKPDINEMRKQLINGAQDMSNLDYVKLNLTLRDALIESGEDDPFLPVGEKVRITQDQIDAANRVATVLQECVDFADGDSGIFTAELQRRTVDNFKGIRRK